VSTDDEVDRAVEEVVRTSYGRLVAYLATTTRDIAAAEDALGDAIVEAVASWRRTGVPDRPESWLLTVARRRLIGAARRDDTAARARTTLRIVADELAEPRPSATIPDRRLELLYVCAHPAIDPRVRAPLMLQVVLGLDAARIASAFVVSPATMGQRLSRAKTKIRDAGIAFEVPGPSEVADRTRNVLDAIYAAYGTGWDDPDGADPKRRGLTTEAERLGRLVVELEPGDAEARGLLALMLHTGARSSARRDEHGHYVPLDEQDVAAWAPEPMIDAEEQLGAALELGELGPYQLQAAIQSVHNRRALTGDTDWRAIAALYDGLVAISPSLGAEVAHAAAHAECDGPDAGLQLLDAIADERVADYQPYWACRAHVLGRLDRHAEAHLAATRAIGLTADPAVRAHLISRFHTAD
jgi:RNA polymerase sigma factor (sigma-70 family)